MVQGFVPGREFPGFSVAVGPWFSFWWSLGTSSLLAPSKLPDDIIKLESRFTAVWKDE